MRNLLSADFSVEQFADILKDCPPLPLLPPIGSAVWDDVAGRPAVKILAEPLRRRAQRRMNEPLPELTDDLYTDFTRTGNRLRFEEHYFERRRRLAQAAVSALLTSDPAERETFLAGVRRIGEAIFSEVSWSLPAHVKNSTGRDPMRIDLFASETANLMGEMLSLFPNLWPAAFIEAVHQRLREQFFENYVDVESDWLHYESNWNAVCHQGVLGAALGTLGDVDLLARMLHRASQYLPNFLKGFTPDGGTGEGPGYWAYGFGRYVELNEQLENRTHGELSLFHDDARMPAIARFGPACMLSDRYLVDFADCPPRALPFPPSLAYLAARFGQPELIAATDMAYRDLLLNGDDVDARKADLSYHVRLLLRAPIDVPPPASANERSDIILPNLGYFIARSRTLAGDLTEFAAKAGHNGEHHNHNDIGSYLFHVNGRRFVMEIGASEYTREFFRNATRYNEIATRSLGHSVPLINGCEQAAGSNHRGRILRHAFSASEAALEIDLTAAYPADAKLNHCVRSFRLDRIKGRLHVEDRFDLSSVDAVESAVMSEFEPRQQGGAVLLIGREQRMLLTPDPGTAVTGWRRHDYRTHQGHDAVTYRIAISPEKPEATCRIGYTLGPALD